MVGHSSVAISTRGQLWEVLAEILSFPGKSLSETAHSGELAERIEGVVAGLPYTVAVPLLSLGGDHPTGLEAAFIELFDAPRAGKACPLYAGVYAPNRRDAMEEILRFYRHFGLTSAGSRELPDSIPTMLEFLRLLVIAEESAEMAPRRQALQAAQRDFLVRHLQRWGTNTRERLVGRQLDPFYTAAIALVTDAIDADTAYLQAVVQNDVHSPSR